MSNIAITCSRAVDVQLHEPGPDLIGSPHVGERGQRRPGLREPLPLLVGDGAEEGDRVVDGVELVDPPEQVVEGVVDVIRDERRRQGVHDGQRLVDPSHGGLRCLERVGSDARDVRAVGDERPVVVARICCCTSGVTSPELCPGIWWPHTRNARSKSALPVGCLGAWNAECLPRGSMPSRVSSVETSITTTDVPWGCEIAIGLIVSIGVQAFAKTT